MNDCFYCQGLKNQPPQKGDKCGFCGVYNNPLYLVVYENKEIYFCCGCAWWQFPRSAKEKEAENRYFKKYFSERAK